MNGLDLSFVHPVLWIVRASRMPPAMWIVWAVHVGPAIWIIWIARIIHTRQVVTIVRHIVKAPSVRGGCRASAKQPGKQSHSIPPVCNYLR